MKYSPMALLRHAEKHIEYHQKSLCEANNALIKAVREKLEKKRLTIQKLASFTGVPLHTIANWFYNGSIPPLETLEKIWHFLR